MSSVVIDYKKFKKLAIRGAFSAAIVTVVLLLMKDQFVAPYAMYGLAGLIAMEWLCVAGFVLLSKNKVILDAEGVTFKSVFGSKTRLWSEIRKYEIGVSYDSGKRFSLKNEKRLYIQLVFQNPSRTMGCDYREDIDQCICRYYGEPDVDARIQNKK